MADLKLAKLPDREPIKMVINLAPELKHLIDDYAAVYETTYGQAESASALIPFMLASFLESDRAFLQARRRIVAARREP